MTSSRYQHNKPGIYFVQVGVSGPIKIGYATNPVSRLAQLQVGNPEELCLLATMDGTFEDEQRLLGRFREVNIRGEWMKPVPELLALIEDLKEARFAAHEAMLVRLNGPRETWRGRIKTTEP